MEYKTITISIGEELLKEIDNYLPVLELEIGYKIGRSAFIRKAIQRELNKPKKE